MPRSSPGSSEGAGLAAVAEMRARVFSTNACDAIPGCPIKIETFLPRMWSAVAKGFIPQAEGEQLQEGLLRGFKLGVDPNLMVGHRWFQNYPSATTTGRTGVAAAIAKRVNGGKTLSLGPMVDSLAHAVRSTFTASCIFPLGAAAKALLPGQTPDQLEWRPTSDHTRTGLNAATDMTGFRFALTAIDEISWSSPRILSCESAMWRTPFSMCHSIPMCGHSSAGSSARPTPSWNTSTYTRVRISGRPGRRASFASFACAASF